jgi:hypothetical protein
MEFYVNEQNYFLRIFRGLILKIVLAALLLIYFYQTNKQLNFFDILVPILIVIISFLRFEHWYRYYITKILIKNETIFCELLDRNKIVEYSFKISELEVNLDKAFALGKIYKLIFIENGERKFIQYQIGEWKEENILKLYDALKK